MSSDSSTTLSLFARGTLARLALWPVMRAAIENSWGGPRSAAKRTWLAGELVDAFERSLPKGQAEGKGEEEPDEEWVATMLGQVMEDEFDVVLEDESHISVARDLCALWSASKSLNETPIKDWEARADKASGRKVDVQVESKVKHVDELGNEVEDDDSDDEDEEGDWEDEHGEGEEAPQLVEREKKEPVVDEDGFTLVQGKGKGRR
ncbi:hypothetical protein PENSPDRAFT_648755 [Peniophora sp. CONT]|nr:hypothetical protein PENSPDRAFT_648755 [Peniophora sp. CONT]